MEDAEYYCVTLLGTADGKLKWEVYSHWAGWADEEGHRELRAASLVGASHLASHWQEIGESYVVVNDEESLALYLRLGGNGLVERTLAERYFKDMIEPHPVAQRGALGFETVSSIPAVAFRRAPAPKHRMAILNRDRRRCAICGRSLHDYVDVELHVHHIRPFGKGGLTDDKNLITLCHTCHAGLDPHQDWTYLN
jgi:hypothetical protein